MPDHPGSSPIEQRQRDLIANAWEQVARVRPTVVGSDAPAGTRAARVHPPAVPLPSEGLPGYRFLGEIHRGGQGVVFEAVQLSTGRVVAVKLMRGGPLAGAAEKFRFEREVQILAQLKHPNIVTIHDSGHASGCDYFVMDYIAGLPLDEYMNRRNPPLRERLEQFVRICDAVNVAHLHGVIHRDLKPGNIRVDDVGVPHVLDFGLAKLTVDPALALDLEQMTQTGQFVGSLPWASPEQAEGRVGDVDVRTDVYSLGVLFYQMLTGRFPYPLSPSISEAVRIIATHEPENPRVHNHEISGELATIVLKCLRKERERRYQSAGELGRDVTRYLRGEPIEAKRDSIGYLLRKHLARRRIAAGVLAAFFLTICVGFVVSLHFWREAVIAADGERAAAVRAQQNERLARNSADSAQREAAKSRAVVAFVTDMLESAAPFSGTRPDYTVREALDAAAARLDAGTLADQPEVEAGVRGVIAASYQSLGQYPAAIRQYEHAGELHRVLHSPDHADALQNLIELGSAHRENGDVVEANRLLTEVIERAGKSLGADSLVTASALVAMAKVHRNRDENGEAASLLNTAIAAMHRQGQPPGRLLSTALSDLCLAESALGRLENAERTAREAIDQTRRLYGNRHIDLAVNYDNLAGILASRGEHAEAERYYVDALEMLLATAGEKHPMVASSYVNLGSFYTKLNRLPEAERFTKKGLELRRETLGEDHPLVAYSLNNLGQLQYQQGCFDEAAENLAEALERLRSHFGEDSSQVLILRNNLAAIQRMRGDYAGAVQTLETILEQRIRTLGADDPDVHLATNNLGQALADAGELERAEELLRSAAEGRRRVFGEHADLTLMSLSNLAGVVQKRGRLHEAERILLDVLAARERTQEPDALAIGAVWNDLGNVYKDQNRLADAEEAYRRAVAIGEKQLPDGHWQRAMFSLNLGVSVAMTGRPDEGVPLILRARDTLLARFGERHPYVRRAQEAMEKYANSRAGASASDADDR